jgi:hypothetical protein
MDNIFAHGVTQFQDWREHNLSSTKLQFFGRTAPFELPTRELLHAVEVFCADPDRHSTKVWWPFVHGKYIRDPGPMLMRIPPETLSGVIRARTLLTQDRSDESRLCLERLFLDTRSARKTHVLLFYAWWYLDEDQGVVAHKTEARDVAVQQLALWIRKLPQLERPMKECVVGLVVRNVMMSEREVLTLEDI